MSGVNKVTLLGNLGKDPEMKTLTGDIKVAKFTMATKEVHMKDGKKVEIYFNPVDGSIVKSK